MGDAVEGQGSGTWGKVADAGGIGERELGWGFRWSGLSGEYERVFVEEGEPGDGVGRAVHKDAGTLEGCFGLGLGRVVVE